MIRPVFQLGVMLALLSQLCSIFAGAALVTHCKCSPSHSPDIEWTWSCPAFAQVESDAFALALSQVGIGTPCVSEPADCFHDQFDHDSRRRELQTESTLPRLGGFELPARLLSGWWAAASLQHVPVTEMMPGAWLCCDGVGLGLGRRCVAFQFTPRSALPALLSV